MASDHPVDANIDALRTQAETEAQILLSGSATGTVMRDVNSPIRSTGNGSASFITTAISWPSRSCASKFHRPLPAGNGPPHCRRDDLLQSR